MSSSDADRPALDVGRVIDALERAAARARRIAAQTGTRLVVVRDGELVAEPVPPERTPVPPSDRPAPTSP